MTDNPDTSPTVIADTRPATHAVRLSLTRTELAHQVAQLPPETMATMQARISEVDPLWLAHALKVMRDEV